MESLKVPHASLKVSPKVYRMPSVGQSFKIGTGSYEVAKSTGMKFIAVLKKGEVIKGKPKFMLRDTNFVVIKNKDKRITCFVRDTQ